MKKFYLLTAVLLCIAFSVSAQSITSIHYWDFNTGSSGVANAKWPSPVAATSTLNAGTLTHNFTLTEDFSGSTLDAPGFSTANAGASFSVLSNANNGNSLILNVSTVGYQGIVLTYATRGTGTGFTTHTIDYSTDGTNYANITTLTGRNVTTFSLQTVDFSAIAAANNNANFKIRITLSGATAAAGNNRFDNFRVTGSLATSNLATVTATTNGSENPSVAGVFTINLNNPAPVGGVILTYNLTGIAKIGDDYTDPQNGTITIPQGNNSGTITLPIVNDASPEASESINCTLLSASNGFNFSTSPATITITDDEATSLYSYSFNSCTGALSDGFTQFSVSGAELWACTGFGFSSNAVQMNGFAGGAAQLNDDWLISPAVNLSLSNVPLLSFYSRTKFAGQSLKVLVSTNYTGTGDPNAASWTEINGQWPITHSDNWSFSQQINLSAFKQPNVYIAFRYVSNAADGASRWTLDEINIIDASVTPAASVTANAPIIDFRQNNFGAASAGKSFSFWADNLGSNLTITAPTGFELSKDGSVYSTSISFTPAETQNSLKTAWARFNPLSANNTYSGYLNFSSGALNTNKFLVKGHSYSGDQTLNVVNWNIEWFGSTAAGQGPADDNLAQANAKTTMEYLNADVYALAEIVDATRFNNLVNSLAGGYSYVLADFCSSGGTPAACASSQKLAFVYKTSVLSNVSARALMNNGVGSNAYNNWASGRYPYLITATVNKNGFTRNINFIVLHAKALDDVDSYNRRKAAAQELKDTLDTYFNNKNVIILGDFNDDLDSTITAAISPRTSPYDIIVSDSTDADSYRSITLPLSRLSLNSTFTNAEMIDHVIVSNEVGTSFIANSASLYNDIGALAGVADFPNTTSDHYPVLTNFLMSSILPFDLLSFDAIKQNNAVRLSWATAREINTKSFVVERSADGRNFKALATVNAAFNSQSTKKYEWIDNSPLNGTSFYRLQMIDADQSSKTSKIARVYFGREIQFSVSPNPAKNFINISIENTSSISTILLTDVNGRLVKQLLVPAGASQNIQLNIADQPKGMYLLKFINNNTVKTEKLVIE
jgi:endonuclease/exonuclease/phosphatase family metal-dependent hydrolase